MRSGNSCKQASITGLDRSTNKSALQIKTFTDSLASKEKAFFGSGFLFIWLFCSSKQAMSWAMAATDHNRSSDNKKGLLFSTCFLTNGDGK